MTGASNAHVGAKAADQPKQSVQTVLIDFLRDDETPMSHTLSAQALRAKVARIIEQAGSSPAEAAQVADNLVMANLSGHDSHGVGMVPRYVDAVLLSLIHI